MYSSSLLCVVMSHVSCLFCFAVIRDMVLSQPVIGQLLVLFCCNTGHGYVSGSDWSVNCFVLL